ncbi:uncharacterized protein BDZ83DRAFT_350360 [Colletotrichum acutatum]|uniref:Uncharacterized protein n=1 Tax=Glomerella acutata TaxID=27357 RepID=A0AAD8UHP9_GLOAC|nr:uncharacterized protein BDZ83DRAFT_350360 [Colletotrichum acutatum]KAK1724487.1 hypothetical protein BDZ83DRAFT_350360 [Colletotrichum acutatum]
MELCQVKSRRKFVTRSGTVRLSVACLGLFACHDPFYLREKVVRGLFRHGEASQWKGPANQMLRWNFVATPCLLRFLPPPPPKKIEMQTSITTVVSSSIDRSPPSERRGNISKVGRPVVKGKPKHTCKRDLEHSKLPTPMFPYPRSPSVIMVSRMPCPQCVLVYPATEKEKKTSQSLPAQVRERASSKHPPRLTDNQGRLLQCGKKSERGHTERRERRWGRDSTPLALPLIILPLLDLAVLVIGLQLLCSSLVELPLDRLI